MFAGKLVLTRFDVISQFLQLYTLSTKEGPTAIALSFGELPESQYQSNITASSFPLLSKPILYFAYLFFKIKFKCKNYPKYGCH